MALSFLVLPREIRDQVYSYLLVTDQSICPVYRGEPGYE